MKRFILSLALLLFSSKFYSTIFLIGVDGCSFNPSSVNIMVGDTIRWYLDAPTDRKTSSMSIPAGAKSWDELLTEGSSVFEYIPTVGGDYYYKSNIMPTCIAHFKVSVAIGINEYKKNKVNCSLFPNPIKKEVLIIHPKNCYKAQLTSVNGKVMDVFEMDPKETNDELDFSSVAASTYVLNILDNKNRIIWSGKVIKTD